jgi:cytosine-specific methyltransferase
MNVLSLFDGMSCGRIALKELGITPNIYYASEIAKFAPRYLIAELQTRGCSGELKYTQIIKL